MCAQISVFIFHIVLRFACHSCSQEQILLTVENTQNYNVEGFFCRDTPLSLSLQ